MNLLPTISPAEAGFTSTELDAVNEAFFQIEHAHSLLILRHGALVSEVYNNPCSANDRHELYSLSKSFTSTAIGIASNEGLIDLERPLLSYFPEYDSDLIPENTRKATVANYLSMASGHANCTVFGEQYGRLHKHFDNDRPWLQNILETPAPYTPGTKMIYNSGATYALSALLRKVTGRGLVDYLTPRFFAPLGFAQDVLWDKNAEGIEVGGWGLNLRAHDIARAALCWTRGGAAPSGKQLIPKAYMQKASTIQIANPDNSPSPDWSCGYGYQFWMCQHGAFRGDGAAGQIALMFPHHDLVIVATTALCNMQQELYTLYESALPPILSKLGIDCEASRTQPVRHASSAVFAPLETKPSCDPTRYFPKNPPAIDFGPTGSPNPTLTDKPLSFTAAPGENNPIGLTSLIVNQTTDGVMLDFTYSRSAAHEGMQLHKSAIQPDEDLFSQRIFAGYQKPQLSSVTILNDNRALTAFTQAHWVRGSALEMRSVFPESTYFFDIRLDLEKRTISSFSNIYFARPWLSKLEIPLS